MYVPTTRDVYLANSVLSDRRGTHATLETRGIETIANDRSKNTRSRAPSPSALLRRFFEDEGVILEVVLEVVAVVFEGNEDLTQDLGGGVVA